MSTLTIARKLNCIKEDRLIFIAPIGQNGGHKYIYSPDQFRKSLNSTQVNPTLNQQLVALANLVRNFVK